MALTLYSSGLINKIQGRRPPESNVVISYEAYQYGTVDPNFKPGFRFADLNNDVTRYVTHGAGVSVPSENLGFYFSGLRAEDWGDIENPDPAAHTIADTLISVDLSEMHHEKWRNQTLPKEIPGRANAELVWVPVSNRGVLVAIGGATSQATLYTVQRLPDDKKKENVG